MMSLLASIAAAGWLVLSAPSADVVASSADHFSLKLSAESALSPSALWSKLIEPAEWWDASHTYSGDAASLALDLRAGGSWSEIWDEGQVTHGTVLSVIDERQLRLDAAFGPLQGMAVTVVWTISLEPTDGGGTIVTFDVVANGSSASGLDAIAPAVEAVKAAAIRSLVAAE